MQTDEIHRFYPKTGQCSDPEPVALGCHLGLGGCVEYVAATLRARGESIRMSTKIDGCWCCLAVGNDGQIVSVQSRTDRHLRVAQAWLDEHVSRALASWHLIGEIVAGTPWASQQRRYDPPDLPPIVYLTAAFSSSGEDCSKYLYEIVRMCDHGRILPIPSRPAWIDAVDWARGTLEGGAEGVVLAYPDDLIRVKPISTYERVISSIFWERDRCGLKRAKARLAQVDRPHRSVQTVMIPDRWHPAGLTGRVVSVVGSSETEHGMIRHARISSLRSSDEMPIIADLSGNGDLL